jgi:hypothetical protein
VRLNPSLVSPVDLLTALSEDLTRPPGLLPPSAVAPALLGRRDEVAEWAHQQLSGQFLPTLEGRANHHRTSAQCRPVREHMS